MDKLEELQSSALAPSFSESAIQTTTLGMGCFWSPEALFGHLPGVIRTRVGYAGVLPKLLLTVRWVIIPKRSKLILIRRRLRLRKSSMCSGTTTIRSISTITKETSIGRCYCMPTSCRKRRYSASSGRGRRSERGSRQLR